MNEHSINVRPALAADAEAIRDVNERAIRVSAASMYTPEQLDAWASPLSDEQAEAMIDQTVTLVALDGDSVVGFASLVVDAGDVDQLYVDPSVGGRGVARLLYEAVEREAVARGVRRLTTTASLRAAPAFSRFGYEVIRREERPFNGQTFAVVQMAKTL